MGAAKIDRIRGALLGLHAGDSAGAAYETWSAERVAKDLEERGGLSLFDYWEPWHRKHLLPAGRPTDDSDQAAILAQSLLACNGIEESDLYRRLRENVYGGVSPLWYGKAFGAGKTTRTRLNPATWEESRLLEMPNEYPSNGALMRATPLALFFGTLSAIDELIVRRACAVTHKTPDAQNAALAHVVILTAILDGATKRDAVAAARSRVGDDAVRTVLNAALQNEPPANPGKWPEYGNALHTLHVALWAFLHPVRGAFRRRLELCIRVGGDTDTYAAVCGSLLGAYYGWQIIQPDWLFTLKGARVMNALAEALYDRLPE